MPTDKFRRADPLPVPFPTRDGRGEAEGFEFDLTYLPTDRLTLSAGIGLMRYRILNVSGATFGLPFFVLVCELCAVMANDIVLLEDNIFFGSSEFPQNY